MRERGRWVPYAAVIATAVLMLVIFAAMANRAYADSTYPPPPPPTTPPPTHTADTGFEGQHDALRAGVLAGVGIVAVGAAAIGRRRARSFER